MWKIFFNHHTPSPSLDDASLIYHPSSPPLSSKATKKTIVLTRFCLALFCLSVKWRSVPLKFSCAKSFSIILPHHPLWIIPHLSVTPAAPLWAPKRSKIPLYPPGFHHNVMKLVMMCQNLIFNVIILWITLNANWRTAQPAKMMSYRKEIL